MQKFFVRVRAEHAGDGVYVPTEATVGPWSSEAQHGGPPSALLVRAAERCLRLDTGRADLAARRYAADFVGPVPVGELRTEARIVRAARTAALVEAALLSGERVCLQARVWFVARVEVEIPRSAPPVLEPGGQPLEHWTFPYARHLEWRMSAGSPLEPGPAAAWIRPRIPLVDGEPLTALQRAVLIGDSASGISSELPWRDWSFANVDLDLHLARDLHGEWLSVEARTILGPDGTGVTRSLLGDARGPVGGGLQTLVVRRVTAH